jgi:hypothetical protein
MNQSQQKRKIIIPTSHRKNTVASSKQQEIKINKHNRTTTSLRQITKNGLHRSDYQPSQHRIWLMATNWIATMNPKPYYSIPLTG